MDCNVGLDMIPDGSVDMVMMDPPYEFSTQGSGAFGTANRSYFGEVDGMSHGLSDALLEKIAAKMDPIVMYAFCSKSQILQYINFAESHGCTWDILSWHKTNPVPTCSNKYLSDTEYIVFVRGKGARVWGNYSTKKKWWTTSVNRTDRELYGHPTVKPLEIVRTLIGNHIDPTGGGNDDRVGPVHGFGDHRRSMRPVRGPLHRLRVGSPVPFGRREAGIGGQASEVVLGFLWSSPDRTLGRRRILNRFSQGFGCNASFPLIPFVSRICISVHLQLSRCKITDLSMRKDESVNLHRMRNTSSLMTEPLVFYTFWKHIPMFLIRIILYL